MFPGMNMNPRQMKMAMQKMGIRQDELDAVRVIIELKDKKLVFNSPEVSKVNMAGNESFQLVGNYSEESIDSSPEISDEDIETVMEQANVSREEAIKAIEETGGDLAEAIMKFQDES